MPIDGARTLRSRVASARNLEWYRSIFLLDIVDQANPSCVHSIFVNEIRIALQVADI